MEWLAEVLLALLALFLSGAVWSCWKRREKPAKQSGRPPLKVRVVYSPGKGPEPEGKMAYTDQVLAECVRRAQDRVKRLA